VGVSDLEDDGKASRTQLCNKRNETITHELLVKNKPKYTHISNFRYMRFLYPRFHISQFHFIVTRSAFWWESQKERDH
jgi:hypothetical protein